ncbi:MAG: penicillin acylase family protein [Calditrichae bacterium]|nr:penicillin acylase family protein [Calditrichia bacterium]
MIVQWDDRRVPHVFAQNDHDLYFTQGYLTARDRLWQMDFITRAAAGGSRKWCRDRWNMTATAGASAWCMPPRMR